MDADLTADALYNIEAHQRDPLAAAIKRGTVLALVAEVRALRAERDRYREALEFIAASPDWKPTWRELVAKSIAGRYRPCVDRARAALDAEEGP